MENKPTILQHTMTWGAILGIILIVIALVLYIFNIMKTSFLVNVLVGLFNIAVIFALVIIGTKAYRDKALGGYIDFGQAFLTGLLIIVFAIILSGFFNLILTTVIDKEYMQKAIEATKDMTYNMMSKRGVSESDIDLALDRIDEKFATYSPLKSFFTGILYWIIGGSIISLITSAILKRSKEPFASDESN